MLLQEAPQQAAAAASVTKRSRPAILAACVLERLPVSATVTRVQKAAAVVTAYDASSVHDYYD
jgi:predicted aconitase with swiveling domain